MRRKDHEAQAQRGERSPSKKRRQCMVDRWAGDSLTRRPKDLFAVSWPRQLGV